MAITITTPPSRIGPGAYVTAHCTDPAVHHIQGVLADFGTGGGGCLGQENSDDSGTAQFQLGYVNDPSTSNKFAFGSSIGLADGTAVVLQVIAFDSGGGFLDSVVFSGFSWDAQSFQSALLGRIMPTSAALVGLDPADPTVAELVGNTQGGTFNFPLIGVLAPVADVHNPVTGGVAVNLAPPGPSTNIGLTWEIVTPAPTVGGTVGVIEEYNRRVAQIVVFHSLFGGVTFADQVKDATGNSGAFFFDSYEPTGVTVYVWPGFTVNFSWLTAA